jgi:hypothetical protein
VARFLLVSTVALPRVARLPRSPFSCVGSSSLNCWAGGGLTTLISLATKSDLHFSHPKLQAWPMIMGEINDCKPF